MNVPANGAHMATLTHEGRFWDVYLELQEPQGPSDRYYRGRLRFSAPGNPVDGAGGQDVYTAYIFLEESPDELIARARSFHNEQLLGLLRSCLP